MTEPRSFTDRPHPAMRSATIEPLAIASKQDRAFVSFADREVNRAAGARDQRDDGGLVALADDAQCSVTTFEREVLDARSNARSLMLVAQASDTRSPLRPSNTASAAWARA